ncbi:MAG: dTDP-4-dehydrorhamnose reductase [Winogradskyella sp.]|nr:dTDP-4-dehydrorhamnose reductase [Winogradskyella sp.]
MKKVLVLGADGQLGKTLFLLSKQTDIDFSFYSKYKADITNKENLRNVFHKTYFEYCINCAAYTNVEKAEDEIEKAVLINATGVRNIAEVCKENNTKLIHISTDYVFDGTNNKPYKTTDLTNPINQYGKSKLQGEKFVEGVLKEHYIVRTSWLYSPFGKNFVKTIIKHIQNDTNLKITTKERGTPTSCLELSRFIFFVITRDNIPFGIYHFSAKGSTTWYDFAIEIVENYNPKKVSNISATDNFKTQSQRPVYSVLDISKTEKFYGQLPKWQHNLKEVLKELKMLP